MLIAPLDWGLGHATRCIPLIEKLLIAGFKVIIAAEGDQKILLQKAFPDLQIMHLKGYRLRYAATKWLTIVKIIFQIPKILIAINREHRWLSNFIKHNHVDVVISDNRFGLHSRKTLSVFITHQLLIKTSLAKSLDRLIQKINYYFINQFNYCWVPDVPGENNLAGELSHPVKMPRTAVRYIGLLSAIRKQLIPVTNKLLVLLSGPEPQRTLLEQKLIPQLISYAYPVILVRGLPAAADTIIAGPVTVYNYLGGQQLEQSINQSEFIISRSGYSTIMDILLMKKKCIFIPTPGQAEQQYLAVFHAGKNHAVAGNQEKLSLVSLTEKAASLDPPDLANLAANGDLEKSIAILKDDLNKK